ELVSFENHVSIYPNSASLFHSRSPFFAPRARRSLGAYRISLETGLLISSEERIRHVASFRYAYRKRRPPHQHLRLLLVSRPPGHNGHGFDRESERRRRRARHLPRRRSLRLSLRHGSRS